MRSFVYTCGMKLSLKNVRGFAGHHEIDFKPLTILLGENSAGKTTIMSSLSAVLSAGFPTLEAVFNKAPFEMGGYDSIATYRGGRSGRADHFEMGVELSKGRKFLLTYENDRGSPRISRLNVEAPAGDVSIEFASGMVIISGKGKSKWTSDFRVESKEGGAISMRDVFSYVFGDAGKKKGESRAMEVMYNSVFGVPEHFPACIASAPLRTKPRRTYDALNEDVKPEGDHIPLVLSRLARDNSADSVRILEELNSFGKAAGLFEKVTVKRKGGAESDPFQVRVKLYGPDANLTDVGYGVSQALPIVIDTLTAPKESIVLIQQPEVHLHPRAQAGLGDFFASTVATSGKQLVVETHSDYLIDRVRMAVANGGLAPDKVQLVYLERDKLDIKVHHLSVDKRGDIVNPPEGYREFFLEEGYRLMTRGG